MVVPTLNRNEVLLDCLGDLLRQDHRPLEILIVDQSDGRSPQLQLVVEQNPGTISHHRVNFRGLPAARNYGWRRARYDAVVFVDDDIRCEPSFVSEHLRTLNLPNVGVVAGGIVTPRTEPTVKPERVGHFNQWTAEPERHFSALLEGDVQHGAGCNFSTWKKTLREAGGFDEQLQVGAALYEETDYCMRAREKGYRVYFNGHARLTHMEAPNGGCRVRDIPRYVYGLAHNRAVMMRRHLAWFHLPTALLTLGRYTVSYAFHYRSMMVFLSTWKGAMAGWRMAHNQPKCS